MPVLQMRLVVEATDYDDAVAFYRHVLGASEELVADADDTARDLAAAGAELIAPPTRTPWGSFNARLDAPAGLQITVFQQLAAHPDAPAPGPTPE